MAQQVYTVPSTAVYRTADGKRAQKFYANDQIPMELAIAFGMSGAELTEPEYFDDRTKTALGTLIAAPGSAARSAVGTVVERTTTGLHLAAQGRPLDEFTTSDQWTAANGATLSLVTTDPHFRSVLSIATAATVFTQVTRDLVLDLRGRFLSFAVKKTDANLQRISIALSVNGRAYTQRFEATVRNGSGLVQDRWHRLTVPLTLVNAAGTPTPDADDFGDVRNIRFEVVPNTSTDTTVHIADLRVHDDPFPAGLIWSFDDGRDDTYTEAFPVLDAAGFRGAIALETANVGDADRCSLAQLQEMYDAGWEFNNHTENGTGLSSADMADVRSEIRNAHAYLMTQGFTRGVQHFVYPGGAWDATILAEVLRHCRTGRTAGGQSYATPLIEDMGLIKPYYFTKTLTLAAAQLALDRIAARGGVLYLTFHSLVETPSATEDWSISDFASLVAYAQSLGLADYLPSELWPIEPPVTT